MNKFKFFQSSIAQLIRGGFVNSFIGNEDDLKFKGAFCVEHFDEYGKLKGKHFFPNGVTNGGKDHALDVIFHGGTQVSPWYIGIIDNSGFTALSPSDTMASHPGWNEFTTYTEVTRQEWDEGAPSSQSINNSSPATFSINGSGTVKGIFVTSNNTKSGTSGILWTTGLFSTNIAVVNGDSLKITYTVNVG